jgi:hypothetical protein
MDINQYISEHIKTLTIQRFLDGFEKGEFYSEDIDPYTFMKQIIDTIMNNTYKPLNKKQSYCAEFNTMIRNLIGVIGMELAQYIFIWNDLGKILVQLVEMIKNTTSIEDLKNIIGVMENIILSKCEGVERVSLNPDTVMSGLKTMMGTRYNSKQRNEEISFNDTIINDLKGELFNSVYKYIQAKSPNLTKMKSTLFSMWTKIINTMSLNRVEMKSINQLCINTSLLNTPYKGSFIKIFEITYRECFTDIPLREDAQYSPDKFDELNYVIPNPTVDFLHSIDISEKKFLKSVRGYFHSVYNKCCKIIDNNQDQSQVFATPSNLLLESLSQIILMICTCIAKQIANQQISYYLFNKVTRIQSFQIMSAIMNAIPRMIDLTPSQKEVLHYILLTSKNLQTMFEKYNETTLSPNTT